MPERIVIDTGPLIALARMGALDLAGSLPFEFFCPLEVLSELQEGARRGHIPVAPEWLHAQALTRPLSPIAVAALDSGEAAVIQLAIEQDIARVCMDECKGRRAAASAGLKVVGALGLIGMAKRRGLIASIRPYIEKAMSSGVYYDKQLIQRILAAAGE